MKIESYKRRVEQLSKQVPEKKYTHIVRVIVNPDGTREALPAYKIEPGPRWPR